MIIPKFKWDNRQKLTPPQVKQIKKELANGVRCKVLAIDYGVAYNTIWDIKHGNTYKSIGD